MECRSALNIAEHPALKNKKKSSPVPTIFATERTDYVSFINNVSLI